MGDCNFSLPYAASANNSADKCKYLYTPWCATCEKTSPRRRSRSETNETCRKKCKEMKSLTPKKYKCNEYENMELEYDFKGWHETKYDCSRIRSNLVELPTSYISNNCQINFDCQAMKNYQQEDKYFNRASDEVDYLREKLKVLQNSAGLEKIIKKPCKNKVSLKTRKIHGRARKARNKSEHQLSESESDAIEDEESESVACSISTDESLIIESVTIIQPESGSGDNNVWPIRFSLFPNIPPYIKFNSHNLEQPYRVPAGKKYFKWKLSTITPIIVRKTLTNSGFALIRSEFTRESNQWLGTWGKHMKSPMFKTLKETQKLNHFPGTFQLGRKDRLWRNFQKMISKHGLKEFGFLPHTYVLPQELKLLKQNWDFKSCKQTWIIKPPASARGVGIKVINKWTQLPKKTSLVCQRYVHNPYLIDGSKFDLRLYVLVTSFHPLRIYLYPDGLARFASAKYSDNVKDLKDRYMHLTNYSINKLSSQYATNEDANACQGHKWTLAKLMEYLQNEGVDTKTLWKNLQQLVIKTIISSEALITPLCEENMNNYYNCYELFGIDVLLDEHLKPWLLEVNISPSLHSASPLDAHVKGPLVQTLFDMAQFHFPAKLEQNIKTSPTGYEPRLYTKALTKKERTKHNNFIQFECRDDYVYDILKELTGDDIRQLIRAEDEFTAKGQFERIFPTAHTHKYLQFMEPRYYNKLFDAWETKYTNRREDGIALLQTMCSQNVHLKVGKNCPNMILGSIVQPSNQGQTQDMVESSRLSEES